MMNDVAYFGMYKGFLEPESKILENNLTRTLEALIDKYGWSGLLDGLKQVMINKEEKQRKIGFVSKLDRFESIREKLDKVPKNLP